MCTSRSGPSKWALASMTLRADRRASEFGAPHVASKKRRASQRRKPLVRTGQVSRWPLTTRSAKAVASGLWNNSASWASSISRSACFGPRPLSSPASSARASSSAVTRQPVRLSWARRPSNRARSSRRKATSASSTSGANGAPGSASVRASRSSSRSWTSSASSTAAQIRSSGALFMLHPPARRRCDRAEHR